MCFNILYKNVQMINRHLQWSTRHDFVRTWFDDWGNFLILNREKENV